MTPMSSRYRLRMSPLRRIATAALLVLIAVFFVPGILADGLELWWRVVSLVGFVTALIGLRIILGAVLVVRDRGLLILRNWPLRRDIPWYRILQIDVIPGFWNLEIELNSGERISLPPVHDLDGLYQRMERHRQALDA
jgi:hypothetical protein